jgi:peptidoglycan hydrolase-like protein with peptidoglycan-binding domain
MENLAYLHLSFVYEDPQVFSVNPVFKDITAPDWKRLSSSAWKYMLVLALIISISSTLNNVLALEKGDQGPSVKGLQTKLKTAGFYQAPITQVYDLNTEAAVRKFQKAAGLPINGVAEADTLKKLSDWKTTNTPHRLNANLIPHGSEPEITHTTSHVRQPADIALHPSHFLQRGDEGTQVKNLQAQLRAAGFYYGNTTGIFGPITEAAVKRFQKAYQLNPDGIVGSITAAKLSALNPAHSPNISPKLASSSDNLKIGDRGESVRILQQELAQVGYLKGNPNGFYGSNTADAVSRFQKNHYLEVNGIAGVTTRAKLFNLVKESRKQDFNVLEIQRRLAERGFYKGQLNGEMADSTTEAIKHAQEAYGISFSDSHQNSF